MYVQFRILTEVAQLVSTKSVGHEFVGLLYQISNLSQFAGLWKYIMVRAGLPFRTLMAQFFFYKEGTGLAACVPSF